MSQPPVPAGRSGQLPSKFRLPAATSGWITALLSVLVVVLAAIVFLLVGRFLGLAMGLVVAVIVAAGLFVGMLVAVRPRRPRTTVRFSRSACNSTTGTGSGCN